MDGSSSSWSSGTTRVTTDQHTLYHAVMRKEWDKVEEMYEEHPELHASKITSLGDTALHLVINLGAPERTVLKLLDEIANTPLNNVMEALAVRNKREDTPLHCAAFRGSPTICRRIIRLVSADDEDQESLVGMRNKHGETPLFVAALKGRIRTFCYLHSVCTRMPISSTSALWRRKKGETILHSTIHKQHFELSYMIIHLYKAQNIAASVDEDGNTPLDILASIPSSFKSGTHLKRRDKLCYSCIRVRQLCPPAVNSLHIDVENSDAPDESPNSTQGSLRKIKEKHEWCPQILEELVKQNSQYEYDENENALENLSRDLGLVQNHEVTNNGRWTALLIAAKHGVKEPVEKILKEIPVAIYQKTRDNENIVLVAVKERQTYILKLLMDEYRHLWLNLREAVDAKGNNALHLAANLSTLPWKGSALQMLYEIKWYEYVKEIMPTYLMSQTNNEGKTPEDIFVDTHEGLVEESNKWFQGTATAYSFVATITASVTFAAAIQVPGGNNDKDGKPILQGQPIFKTFNISTLVAFCFSIASLATFLSILSSRKKPQDFKTFLPLMLLVGLSSFFTSIVALLVSFCTAHSFDYQPGVLNRPSSLYALTLIPLFFYAVPQLPLCWILLKASFAKLLPPKYRGQVVSF